MTRDYVGAVYRGYEDAQEAVCAFKAAQEAGQIRSI